MPPSRNLGIGFIGCGNVLDAYVPQALKLHARGIASPLLACGRPQQRDRALALGIPAFTTSEAELLSHPNVEVVVILASMPEHARLVEAALRAGKHVLVEKPLATELGVARELVALARRLGLHLSAAPFTPLSPTFKAIAHRIGSGAIGRAVQARARYGWAGPWWNEWFYKPGGGCLLDLGVYCLTTLTGLLGPVRRVTALAGVAIPTRDIGGRPVTVEAEDNAQVLLDFGNACFASVATGFTLQKYRSPAIEIYGTGGTLQMLGDDWDPDGYEWWENAAGCWRTFGETHPDWPWTDGLRDLVESIQSGCRPESDPDHALHVLEVILAAQQSAREGRVVPIESSFEPRAVAALAPDGGHPPVHLQHDRTRDHGIA